MAVGNLLATTTTVKSGASVLGAADLRLHAAKRRGLRDTAASSPASSHSACTRGLPTPYNHGDIGYSSRTDLHAHLKVANNFPSDLLLKLSR